MNIPSKDTDLYYYLKDLQGRIEALEAAKYPVIATALPAKPTLGMLYYFKNTIGATITSAGLWVYKVAGWTHVA